MKNNARLNGFSAAAYIATVVFFLAFFVFMGFSDGVSITSTRPAQTFFKVSDATREVISDPEAPAGVHEVFRWTLSLPNANENCLGFYTVHQYVEVQCAGETIYRLEPYAGNRITQDVGSNWVNVPLYPSDAGKDVTVTLTPVYASGVGQDMEFLVGSRYAIFADCLQSDLPQLALAVFCVLIGLYVGFFQLFLIRRKRSHSMEKFFLSNFLVLLGVWRMMDLRCAPMLLPNHTLLAGYVTIGTLFLCCIPLLLFLREHLADCWSAPLSGMALAVCAVAIIVLLLQILHIADFRQVLVLCHLMFVLSIVLVLWSVADSSRRRTHSIKSIIIYMTLLIASALVDLILFYVLQTSLSSFITVAMIFLSTVVLLTYYFLDTSIKIFIDAQTGLYNKLRWDELMDPHTPLPNAYGLIMLDFNNLKTTNDTLGHEAGDAMILRFADILRSTLPSNSIICRWGGDEFTAMLPGITQEGLDHSMTAIQEAVDKCNASRQLPVISYAGGCVLSTEYPDLPRRELLHIADDRMYENKLQWHAQKSALPM